MVYSSALAILALLFSGSTAGGEPAPSAKAAPLVPASVRITPESDLHFGTFMVFGSGRRTVDVRGGVIDEAIVPLEGSVPAPARFTVTYDRGNQNRQVLDIEIDLFLSTVGAVRMQGVEGRLSALQTDLPGASLPDAGQPIRLSIPNCRTRTCSRTFHVGGTLNVTRGPGGGASLVIPIPIYADLVSDDRQRR